ncbi:hypothetical protein C5167_025786 [Papaver somniferum]|uniref:Peptidase C1A papain C-terminal domain-containing protein n=1 Tax=Papaver somniferum TaxID=3469 RepID=A0A4Y7JWE6_PAPSO|nr:hypothetical protein C5167_025786 [Papaver somniferum]
MATSVLLRLRLASVNSTDLVTRCLPGATPRRNTPLIQKWGNLARLFSSKPKPLGDDSDVIGVMEGKEICTAADNQTQGEIAPDIKLLAEFRAMGFSPAPAKTMLAGKEQQNTIKLSGGLLESYIEDMIPEAVIVHERWRGADESTYSLTPYCNDVIGIDLGTINSCVSMMRNNIPEVIHNADGVHNIPSVVAFGPKGELLVKATSGDTFFGGVDFDSTLLEFLVSEIKRTDSIDLSKDRLALHRLREAAEKAKIELSSISQSEINLPFIKANASGAKHLNITLTRPKLESLFNHLIQRTQNACRVCLKDAGVSVEDIHEVLCVGGMTRMPLVQEAVSEIFSSASIVVSPDDAVAMGAAIYGGIHHGYVKDVLLLEITARSIAVESFSGEVTTLINKNKFIPTTISTRFSTGDHNQTPVILRLLEGEDVATDFELIGVPYAPKGLPVIEVNLGLNSDGMIDISAKSTQFCKEEILGVELSDGTQSDNKSRMVIREAEQDIVQKCPTDMKRSADFLLKRSLNAVEPFIVDWRAEGAVTPVMCQKKVGTCWACAAVSAVENYPYVKSQSCELRKKSIVWIKGCVYVPVEAMEIIKAVSKQPLFACLTPEFASHPDYYNYVGGPYYGGDKNVPIDANPTRHAVCIVGHGNYKGEFFLILKDSKGEIWGYLGYMYLVINPDLAKQIEYVSYPVM